MAVNYRRKEYNYDGHRYGYRKNCPPPRQDNKGYYSSGCAATDPPEHPDRWYDGNTIRVPSMKRSRSTWKRFYKLFPHLRYMDTFRGNHLKKI